MDSAPSNQVRQPLVFLADDDAELRTLVAGALRAVGLDVCEASDGAELMSLLEDSCVTGRAPRPALVITDDQMPRISGLRVLRWLGTATPGLPVVVITAFGSPTFHASAKSLGAVAVIDKPFEMTVIEEVVGTLARRGGSRVSRQENEVPAIDARTRSDGGDASSES